LLHLRRTFVGKEPPFGFVWGADFVFGQIRYRNDLRVAAADY
jgi:hypothetical protein